MRDADTAGPITVSGGRPSAPRPGPAWWGLGLVAAVLAGPGLTPEDAAAQTGASMDRAVEAARGHREANAPAILESFRELLRIPNVASDADGIRRNAAAIAETFRRRGAEMELLELPGRPEVNPVVYGALDVAGATRTVGIYVHYDGQPADPANWTHAPWEPTLYTASMEAGGTPRDFPEADEAVDGEWRIYARSAGDDKAPLAALPAALDALERAGIRRTSNLRFLFDGEEEAGSPNLEAILEEHRDRFDDVDLWLFFDGPVHQSGRPQLTFGVRGVTGMSLTVYGATRSLHSGHYGNWAPVPGQLLADLLDSMKDADTGEVLVEGFYDTVEPLGEAERAALDALPEYDDELRRELGLARTEGPGQSLGERLLLPSLTVRGMASGNVGALARNVIPSTAEAVLGIRLVKGNDPEHMQDLVEAHIRSQGWHVVREDPEVETRLAHPKIVKVERGVGYPAARTEMGLPEVDPVVAAMEVAGRSALEREPVLVPALGGTLPLYLFTDVLDRPALIVPVANHDNNQHAPDENLRLANLWYAIDLYAALLTMPEVRLP